MNVAKSQALVAYVPVLHKGYIDFFAKNHGDIFIFGSELIKEYVHLGRDIRALETDEMIKALSAVLPGRPIRAVTPSALKQWTYESTLMPDDEVCHDLGKRYFAGKKITYVSVFLRWNRVITFKEFEIPAHRKITTEQFHTQMIDDAFRESQKSSDWWRQIGALAVKKGKVIYAAHNHHLPTDFHLVSNGDPRSNFDAGEHQDIFTSIHAEAEIIARAAADGAALKGLDVYTTTFPCPNCARLIGTAGVKTVYYSKGYSLLDAEKILNHFGVEVVLVE